MRLSELAALTGAEVLGGDHGLEIKGAASISEAASDEITFAVGGKNLKTLVKSSAGAAFVNQRAEGFEGAQLKVDDPYYAFIKTLENLFPVKPPQPGTNKLAFVEEGASVHEKASLYPYCYVSEGAEVQEDVVLFPGVFVGRGVSIGSGTVLHPNVVVFEGTRIGRRVVIHPGAVIGADGFGYHRKDDRVIKVPHVGGVEIGDDVEIGANTTVDRATTGMTVMGDGVKVDNQVQIAHNVRIGANTMMAAQTGISGSVTIGDDVLIGGRAGVADHVSITSRTVLAAGAGVIGNIEKSGIYSGFPARGHKKWLRASAEFMHLPELRKRLFELETEIQKLKRRVSDD